MGLVLSKDEFVPIYGAYPTPVVQPNFLPMNFVPGLHSEPQLRGAQVQGFIPGIHPLGPSPGSATGANQESW